MSSIYSSFQAVIVVSIFCKFFPDKTSQKVHSKCIVLGNGPSLKNDIVALIKCKSVDFFCVNNFAESTFFTELMPRQYIFIDSYFWRDDVSEDSRQKRELTFRCINERTNWSLVLNIPYHANLKYIKKHITNKNVKFRLFNAYGVPGFCNSFAFFLFRKRLISPLGVNVLAHAIHLAILERYEHVDFYGADFTFHKLVQVDQKNNYLYRDMEYFNGSQKEYMYMDVAKTVPKTMENEFNFIHLAFETFETVSTFAKKQSVPVINKSSYSMLDSFDRE